MLSDLSLVLVENTEQATTGVSASAIFKKFIWNAQTIRVLDETLSLHVNRLIMYFRKLVRRVW